MTENTNRPPEAQDNQAPLESWKEIATYLNRTVRTVKRWEKDEALPVRRHLHQARSSVYAYASELEAWKAARQPGFDQAVAVMPWRRPIPALGLTAVLLLALLSVASGPILTPASAANGEPGSGMVARQVWAGPGVDLFGAPSPDGRFLTFVDWSTGDLAVRELATGVNRRLTNKGSWLESDEYAYYSIVSPDGQQVAYSWIHKGGFTDLRLIGLDGSNPHVIYRNEETPWLEPNAWSPDGEHILTLFARTDKTWQIGLVSAADGAVRVLKTLDWRRPRKMSFSPDGRYVVYDFPPKEDSPERDIFLLATDGSREIPLVQHPADDRVLGWIPDGKAILFASHRTGTMAAWVIRVAEGKPQGSPELVKRELGRSLPLGFTQEGSYYYGLSTLMQDVYVAELDPATGKVLAPPTKAIQNFVGSNHAPDWSPDGKYLAYLSERGSVGGELGSTILSIRSLETSEERELALELRISGNPRLRRVRWSPDGRSLLVNGRDRKLRRGLYQIDAQTGNVRLLVRKSPGGVRWHEWSPDGKKIFYNLYAPPEGTFIMMRDLETGRDKVLYRGRNTNVALSPDGRQLAFTTRHPATQSVVLMVMPAAGGEPRELLSTQPPETIPLGRGIAWMPDGRHLLFLKVREVSGVGRTTTELWRVPAEGGQPRKLELAMQGLRALRFHPDGKRVVFTAGKGEAEIWVLENFLPKPETKAARLEDE